MVTDDIGSLHSPHVPTQTNLTKGFRLFFDGASASCIAEAISLPLEVAKACFTSLKCPLKTAGEHSIGRQGRKSRSLDSSIFTVLVWARACGCLRQCHWCLKTGGHPHTCRPASVHEHFARVIVVHHHLTHPWDLATLLPGHRPKVPMHTDAASAATARSEARDIAALHRNAECVQYNSSTRGREQPMEGVTIVHSCRTLHCYLCTCV
jgi:hypothetical protein